MSALLQSYAAPGPVAAAFIADPAIATCIMGPIGSGKTTAALMRAVQCCLWQAPGAGGVRRAKVAVIRDTYRNLDKTTIPSWQAWFPPTLGTWSGKEPVTHTVRFDLAGQPLELVTEFIALGDRRIEDVMRGWEGTGAYLNEADLLAPEVLHFVSSRVGRYPSAAQGGCTWSGVWLDCNAPDEDNWIYQTFVENRAAYTFRRQPGGREPGAENLNYLNQSSATLRLPLGHPDRLAQGRRYYERMIAGKPDWWVRRFIDNQFGYDRSGQPVFLAEFSDAMHVAPAPLEADRGLPLLLGADAGLTPAIVIFQRRPNGQWRGLDEIVPDRAGPTRMAELLNQVLAERYRDHDVQMIDAWADPSSEHGADREAGEQAWIEIMAARTGINFRPAPTNELGARLDACREPMRRMIDNATPGIIISPRMRVLRKAWNSGYRFRKTVVAGQTRFELKPDKNEFSHVADAAQYVLLGGGGNRELRRRVDARHARAGGLQRMRFGFNVFG